MKITGKELHNVIEMYVPGFEDAELWEIENIEVCENFQNQIVDTYRNGYISINSQNGAEVYYTNL